MISPDPEARAGSSRSLLIQSWTLVAVAFVSLVARFASRYLQISGGSHFSNSSKSNSTSVSSFESHGRVHACRASLSKVFRRLGALAADDYLMVLAFASLVIVAYAGNEVAANGSNYVEEGETDGWTREMRGKAVWGSKMLVALEQAMVACLWLVKACLLILYWRLTSNLPENLAVKLTSVYCVLGFAVMETLYLGVWCRPMTNYWAVPIPPGNDQCKSYHNHLITLTAFHISSDILILAIPLPMIMRARLPLRQKLVLCFVFSLGLLVVLLAILNRYYNFVLPHDLVFLAWYNGEASTAVIIANVPFLWTLLRRVFALEAWGGRKGCDPRAAPKRIGRGGHVRGLGQDAEGMGVTLSDMNTREGGSLEAFACGGKPEW
ncbi:hypothetical protein B0T18DRAFT_330812 [Schizothecium vesticola]|uniref:Rhodopsin domain-containing protein n=1 Tax=Schizothecium vesticola TaxID=314040 RepID=A0AA40ELN4_9PEZI|nr:hypothetical protein B0T18DRAFT_330812 [Schizothecium vesticola]